MPEVIDTPKKKNVTVVHPTPKVLAIALKEITESPSNPRKTFAHLDELADNIRVYGVLQPVTVRETPKGKTPYELVFGARRFRASKLAKLDTIPAMVRVLDDATALEIQIIENSKREDIHPLEEADGYQVLHTKHGFSVEEIAAKVGKSAATIYGRLKLCTLVPDARKAFLEDRLSAASAIALARIPHADLQKKALDEVLKMAAGRDQLLHRDVVRTIQSHYMLRLADAQFDRADKDLIPGAVACGECPKRTGAQAELFSDVEGKDDLCTDTKCFQAKSDAGWAKKAEAAKAMGQMVLTDKEAKTVFSAYGGIVPDAGFVDLDATTWKDGENKKNAALVGKDVPVILARDPDGNVRRLADATAFRKATREKAKEKKISAAEKREEEARKRSQRQNEAKRAAELELIEAISKKSSSREPNVAWWRALATALNESHAFLDLSEAALARHAVHADADLLDALPALIAKISIEQIRGLIVDMVLGDRPTPDTLANFAAAVGITSTKKKAIKPATKKAPKPKSATKKKTKKG